LVKIRVGGLLVKYVFLTSVQKPDFFTTDFTDFTDARDPAKNEVRMKARLTVQAGGFSHGQSARVSSKICSTVSPVLPVRYLSRKDASSLTRTVKSTGLLEDAPPDKNIAVDTSCSWDSLYQVVNGGLDDEK
jgi:hypothetical protein